MEEMINIQIEEESGISIKNMVNYFEEKDLSFQEIAEYICDMDEVICAAMYLLALLNENVVLANKIEQANEFIKRKRMSEFKESVMFGTHDEFLSKMSLADKTSLLMEIRKSVTNADFMDQEYCMTLQNSIEMDMEKMAVEQGFSTVKEWRNYNRRIAVSNRQAMEAVSHSLSFRFGNAMSKVLKKIKGRI